MSIAYYGSELVNIAIGIERQGIAFYDVLARSTRNPGARQVFQHLEAMEREHIKVFHGMLEAEERVEKPESYSGDYAAYLQALASSAVFTDELAASQQATQVESDAAAVELGIRAEKDSILFYYEMQDRMPEGARPKIEKVLAEEKRHLSELTNLRGALGA